MNVFAEAGGFLRTACGDEGPGPVTVSVSHTPACAGVGVGGECVFAGCVSKRVAQKHTVEAPLCSSSQGGGVGYMGRSDPKSAQTWMAPAGRGKCKGSEPEKSSRLAGADAAIGERGDSHRTGRVASD